MRSNQLTLLGSIAARTAVAVGLAYVPAARADVREYGVKRKVVVERDAGEATTRVDGKIISPKPPSTQAHPSSEVTVKKSGHEVKPVSGLMVPEKDLDQVLNEIQEQYAEGGQAAPASPPGFPPAVDRSQNSFVRPEMMRRGVPDEEEQIVPEEDE